MTNKEDPKVVEKDFRRQETYFMNRMAAMNKRIYANGILEESKKRLSQREKRSHSPVKAKIIEPLRKQTSDMFETKNDNY